jgi:hypothetical protein
MLAVIVGNAQHMRTPGYSSKTDKTERPEIRACYRQRQMTSHVELLIVFMILP